MSADDTLCFDDFDPVTGAPTPDGFLLHDLGLEDPAKVEMGYTGGCRYTWSGGGEALAIFQGVKSGDFLILGFFTRYDLAFNSNDKIIIALKHFNPHPNQPGWNSERRISISPVFSDFGAGASPAPEVAPDIRADQQPSDVKVYRGARSMNTRLRWEQCSSGFEQTIKAGVKVRSWHKNTMTGQTPRDVGWSVEVKVPLKLGNFGADWIDVIDPIYNPDRFKLFFSIVRRIDFGNSTYYSELLFPRDKSKLGVGDPMYPVSEGIFLDIPDSSYGTGLIGSGLGEGVRFKDDYLGIGRLRPTSADGLLPPNVTFNTPSTSNLITQTMSKSYNRVVARIENTSSNVIAADIQAEFRFGRYGLQSRTWGEWKQPVGMEPRRETTKRTDKVTLSRAPVPLPAPPNIGPNVADVWSDWTLTTNANDPLYPGGPIAGIDEVNDFSRDWHRCMVANLFVADPVPGTPPPPLGTPTGVNFTQSSVRSNTDFLVASEVSRAVEVSGVGYPPPLNGNGEQEFVLLTFARVLSGPKMIETLDIENGEQSTAALARRLLAEVIPAADPEDAPAFTTDAVTIEPGELRWGPGDQSSRMIRFTGGDKRRRLQLRVLRPSSLDGFDWAEVDSPLSPGKTIDVIVTPKDRGDSTRTARIPYHLLGLEQEGKPEALQSGAVLLTQQGANTPKPGTNWKDALASSQVIVWTTIGYRRTGTYIEVDGVTGEVLDESPGQFAVVALHEGLNDTLSWQLSGPGLSWEGPGVNTLRVPEGGVKHLDLTLKAEKEGEPGDRGPRHVQADPLEIEWGAEEADPKAVTFTRGRESDLMLVLEVPLSAGESENDFVWKEGLADEISVGATVPIKIRPPQTAAIFDRFGEMRYRVLRRDSEEVVESGRVRLVRRGGKARTEEPPDKPPQDTFMSMLLSFLSLDWLRNLLGWR